MCDPPSSHPLLAGPAAEAHERRGHAVGGGAARAAGGGRAEAGVPRGKQVRAGARN